MPKPINLTILALISIFVIACKKTDSNDSSSIDNDFSYATTNDLNINLKYLSSDNKPLKYVLVSFYYPDSKNATDPVFKALADSNGVLKGHFAAPAYKNALIVDVKYPGIGRNMTLMLEDKSVKGVIRATSVSSTSAKSGYGQVLAVDSDGDLVEDSQDEFPTDPQRAYTRYYPSKDTWGTLAFEDSWPKKGDYDMNDLVVNYNYAIICNTQSNYVEMTCNYKVVAAGANNTNGFGVNLPYIGLWNNGVSPISSVTGQLLTENYIKVGAAGFDNNGINIVPFDNHRSVFNGASGPINVSKGVAKVEGKPISVHVSFSHPVSSTTYSGKYYTSRVGFTLYDVPFNPFLIAKMKPQYEIHQPFYRPSATAMSANIMALYGTFDDPSVMELYAEFPSGLYRTKDGGKPWVLNFAEGFDYPTESSSISEAYLHYDDWKAGRGYTDWYLDKPGYRNSNLVYK